MVPSEKINNVPDNPIEMNGSFLSLGIIMPLACMYKEKVYIEFFAKVSIIFSRVDNISYTYIE